MKCLDEGYVRDNRHDMDWRDGMLNEWFTVVGRGVGFHVNGDMLWGSCEWKELLFRLRERERGGDVGKRWGLEENCGKGKGKGRGEKGEMRGER